MQLQSTPSLLNLPASSRNRDTHNNGVHIISPRLTGQSIVDLVRSIAKDELIGPVTPHQLNELQACEAVIRRGFQTFYDVGKAFARIRDARLYRDKFDTFEAYCREKWQYGRDYADRLIAAAEIVTHLQTIDCPLPERETHVRPLIGLTKEQAAAAWKEALELAREVPMTVKLVKGAAAKFKKRESTSGIIAPTKIAAEAATRQASVDKVMDMIQQVEELVRTGQNPQTTLTLLTQLRDELLRLK